MITTSIEIRDGRRIRVTTEKIPVYDADTYEQRGEIDGVNIVEDLGPASMLSYLKSLRR